MPLTDRYVIYTRKLFFIAVERTCRKKCRLQQERESAHTHTHSVIVCDCTQLIVLYVNLLTMQIF
jgi:hypothetical protein